MQPFNYTSLVFAIVFLFFSSHSFAQTKAEVVNTLIHEAVQLMDNGRVDESLELLEEAKALDPKNTYVLYEMAYAYYLKADYKASISILEKIKKKKDIDDYVFQLLGNSYSMSNDPARAIRAYEEGIKRFPKSGRLYLERGTMEMKAQRYNSGLSYYEKGIEVDPKFPSNYYWCTKLYCNSNEKVWGMIYGEIFLNLESSTRRSSEISQLLYENYKSQIQFPNDSTTTVSFSKNNTIYISNAKDISQFKMPFGVGIYEPTLALALSGIDTITIQNLYIMRKSFVENYFKMGHDRMYPNALFTYQEKVIDAGHFESYTYWLLLAGDQNEFAKWKEKNLAKWKAFESWFGQNAFKPSESNRFFTGQY